MQSNNNRWIFSFVNNVVNGNSRDNYVHEHNVFRLIKNACCLICFQIAIPSAMLCVRIAYGICIKSDFGQWRLHGRLAEIRPRWSRSRGRTTRYGADFKWNPAWCPGGLAFEIFLRVVRPAVYMSSSLCHWALYGQGLPEPFYFICSFASFYLGFVLIVFIWAYCPPSLSIKPCC